MTPEDLAAVRKTGEKCRAKGCRCLARCYHCFNKWWAGKAGVCTHPNWCPADDEWWGDTPPAVGNKPKPQKRLTVDEMKAKYKQGKLK